MTTNKTRSRQVKIEKKTISREEDRTAVRFSGGAGAGRERGIARNRRSVAEGTNHEAGIRLGSSATC